MYILKVRVLNTQNSSEFHFSCGHQLSRVDSTKITWVPVSEIKVGDTIQTPPKLSVVEEINFVDV